jgi:hypothetical protein
MSIRKLFKPKYRIVKDLYRGYEVQIKRFFFPIWVQAGFSNTFSTIEDAERFAINHANRLVKHLGRL